MNIDIEKRLHEVQTETTRVPRVKEYITSSIPRTYLLGNGDMGSVSFGNASGKGFILSKGNFWNCGDLKTAAVMEYSENRVMPLPVGQVCLNSRDFGPFIGETLDLYTATIITQYRNVTIRSFVSRQANVLHVSLHSCEALAGQIELSCNNEKKEDFFHAITGGGSPEFIFRSRSVNNALEDNRSWTSEVAYGMLCQSPGSSFRLNEDTVARPFRLERGEDISFAVLLEGGGKTYDNLGNQLSCPSDELKRNAGLLSSFSKAHKKHKEWWREFWERSSVSIGDDELERFYYGSLYLTAACSAPGKLPPGIMGIWPTNYTVKWNGDYHMNYNYIAPFYGVYTANRCELSANLCRPLLDAESLAEEKSLKDLRKIIPYYIEGGVYRGKEFPGRADLKEGIPDGALFPVALGPYGVLTWEDDHGGSLNQMNNGAFTMSQFASQYLHTFDETYIREVFPLLRKTIMFFIKWSEKEYGEDGDYRYTVLSGAHEDTVDKNAVGVLASIGNILDVVFTAIENGHISIPRDELEQWNDYKRRLSDFPVLENFTLRKIFRKPFKKDILPLAEEGMIHWPVAAPVNLEAIHPLEQINMFSHEKLLAACRNTVDLKIHTNKSIWSQINCFPKLYTQAVRIGYDPEVLVRNFKKVLRRDMKYNYTVKDRGDIHGIEKAGAIEFINSMLLFSDGHTVAVFPNWLPGRDGSFYRLLGRGGFETSSSWSGSDRKVEKVEIRSLFRKVINLVNPFEKAVVADEAGVRIPHELYRHKNGREILRFPAEQKRLYTVKERNI